jgi:hypothetical protein
MEPQFLHRHLKLSRVMLGGTDLPKSTSYPFNRRAKFLIVSLRHGPLAHAGGGARSSCMPETRLAHRDEKSSGAKLESVLFLFRTTKSA